MKIDVGGGTVITASITNDAASDLKLKAGDPAYAGDQGVRRDGRED